MYIVIAIRNLDAQFNWEGSYFIGTKEKLSDAIELAKQERQARGYHKYGCIIYSDITDASEVYCLYKGHDEGILNDSYQKVLKDETI